MNSEFMLASRDISRDDDDDIPIDDSDDEYKSRSETVEKMISEMTEEERTRYNIFQSQTCRFPKNKVKSLMQNAVPGVQVQNKAVTVASFAVRLFSAELIELAREISGNEEPLTPDLIMIALNEIIDKGTIPGLGPGTKKSQQIYQIFYGKHINLVKDDFLRLFCPFKNLANLIHLKLLGVSKYIEVISGDEEDLQANIEEYGPACVAIDASHWSFQLYTSGIYDEPRCSSTALDHCVGCVGFGVEGTTNYWIVRDSWGESWGEDGYIRMIKNKNNQCGIETDAVIPIA